MDNDKTQDKVSSRRAIVEQCLSKHIKGWQFLTAVGTELSYALPLGQLDNYPDCFDELHNNRTSWGISNFGVRKMF